jgi:hypothetical protein
MHNDTFTSKHKFCYTNRYTPRCTTQDVLHNVLELAAIYTANKTYELFRIFFLFIASWFPGSSKHFIFQRWNIISVTGPTRCTICCQFININSLYMFQALICSSSGGTVYTTIGIFCVYYVGWLLAGLHLVDPITLIYYDAWSTKHWVIMLWEHLNTGNTHCRNNTNLLFSIPINIHKQVQLYFTLTSTAKRKEPGCEMAVCKSTNCETRNRKTQITWNATILTSCQTGLWHTELYTDKCKLNESKMQFWNCCCHLNGFNQSDIV